MLLVANEPAQKAGERHAAAGAAERPAPFAPSTATFEALLGPLKRAAPKIRSTLGTLVL